MCESALSATSGLFIHTSCHHFLLEDVFKGIPLTRQHLVLHAPTEHHEHQLNSSSIHINLVFVNVCGSGN